MTDEEREAQAVVVELRASVAIVRLNRPAERNQLSIATLTALDAAVSQLKMSADISALIFTGTEDVFASGANIRELRALTPGTAGEFAQRGQNLFQKIADATQLTIAAINGYCMGGGLDLALACDLRCASTGAVFAHPGARLGIITGWGGTWRLPRLIGTARAFEMFATARRVTSSEALSFGLVSSVSESALDAACGMAERYVTRNKSEDEGQAIV